MTQKIRLADDRVVTVAEFWDENPGFIRRGGMPSRSILDTVGATIEPAQPLTQAQKDAENTLTPQQFLFMMNLPRPGAPRGWGAVWEDVTDALRSSDPVRAAELDSHHAAATFRLSATLEMIALVKPITDRTHPNVDLSEATVRAAWQQAK